MWSIMYFSLQHFQLKIALYQFVALCLLCIYVCAGLKLMYANLEENQNQVQHNTEGLNSNGLVVRRGQPFKITLSFDGPYISIKDDLMLRTDLSINASKYEGTNGFYQSILTFTF